MAWISIHDTIDGPKLRSLYKKIGCTKCEALGLLCFMWLWGLNNADADGKIVNADEKDIRQFVVGCGCSFADNENIVEILIESGWIDVVDSSYYFHDWDVWQELWYKYKKRKEDDVKRKRKDKEIKLAQEKAKLPLLETIAKKNEETASQQKTDESAVDGDLVKPKSKYSKGFEKFWEAYPRKVDKGAAYKKYNTRLKDGYSEEELLSAAQNYAADVVKRRTSQEYIKHAKTFLSDTLPFTDWIAKADSDVNDKLPNDSNPFEKCIR